jgi:hypothetical protein
MREDVDIVHLQRSDRLHDDLVRRANDCMRLIRTNADEVEM